MNARPITVYEVPAGAPRRSCLSCGRAIYWIETASGKRMPVDVDTKGPHWATCPNADQHRGNPRQQGLFNDGGRKA